MNLNSYDIHRLNIMSSLLKLPFVVGQGASVFTFNHLICLLGCVAHGRLFNLLRFRLAFLPFIHFCLGRLGRGHLLLIQTPIEVPKCIKTQRGSKFLCFFAFFDFKISKKTSLQRWRFSIAL